MLFYVEYNKPWIFYELIPFTILGILGVNFDRDLAIIFPQLHVFPLLAFVVIGAHRNAFYPCQRMVVSLPEELPFRSIPCDRGADRRPYQWGYRISKPLHSDELD